MNQGTCAVTSLQDQGFPSREFLYSQEGIAQIDGAFVEYLSGHDAQLQMTLIHARKTKEALSDRSLMDLSEGIEAFLVALFGLEESLDSIKKTVRDLNPLLKARTAFVQRFVLRNPQVEVHRQAIDEGDGPFLENALSVFLETKVFEPMIFAKKVMEWLGDKEKFHRELQAAYTYTLWRVFTLQGQSQPASAGLFDAPFPKHYDALIKNKKICSEGEIGVKSVTELEMGQSYRGGEKSLEFAIGQMKYCLLCHPQKKDSCSSGLRQSDGAVRKNPLDRALHGCPLRQKISQMNSVACEGFFIGALAIITLDNPLVAGTGAHICNDCKESCIFQKQDGVDVPRIETKILREVLELPFGFEIYSLLTRWNPLCVSHPIPAEQNGFKVLVVGLGPAGCMISHLLINQGYTVVGIDGLKADPLPQEYVGTQGNDFALIKDSGMLFPTSDARPGRGFGGVLDYGITARWDKRFLTILRLLLERRAPLFTFLPSVRFGGALDESKARTLGFDHVSLCLGAGAPKRLSIEHDLIKGVVLASDFLMGIHRGGGSRNTLMVPSFIRLPCVILGGGLTAVDAATEVIHGYIEQIHMFKDRYTDLSTIKSEREIRAGWTLEDCQDADVFLAHGKALLQERALALEEGRSPDYGSLIASWGGVHLLYRKALMESPAYKINSEELQKALETGVLFHENTRVTHLFPDHFGTLTGVGIQKKQEEDQESSPLSVFETKMAIVAYGTDPNTVIMREGDSQWTLSDMDHLAEKDNFILPERSLMPSTSVLGDMNPKYAGSVVKAMASAKDGLEEVIQSMAYPPRMPHVAAEDFSKSMTQYFKSYVKQVRVLGPKIIELILDSPFAAHTFQPGQFFRLSNYESLSLEPTPAFMKNPQLALEMEGVALTGCQVDKEKGTLSLVVLEEGISSSLVKSLKEGDEVSLMGPTGKATEIPTAQKVLLVGGGLGNAVLFSLAEAMKEKGCTVYVVSGYKSCDGVFKRDLMESVSDRIMWCFEAKSQNFVPKATDLILEGTVVDGLQKLMDDHEGRDFLTNLGTFMTIGSAAMMEATQKFFQEKIRPLVSSQCTALASINAPMNCMLKEICGKCIQRHCDSKTGLETYVFSCTNQDQSLESVDFSFLKDRLSQNHLLENLNFQWKAYGEADHSL